MLYRRPLWLFLLTAASLAGCPSDDDIADAGLDGSVDGSAAGSVDGSVLATPPVIPWLTDGVPPMMLAPCPEGWREVRGGSVTECDPYPEGGAASCDAGEAHFPGEPGCRPIGDPCPTGDYAPSLPTTGPVVYVNVDGAAGGDGTEAAPHVALSEVPWMSLSTGTTVAIAKGEYPGTLPLRAGVTVVGACVRDTVVTGIAAAVQSVVSVTNGGTPAEVRNLTVRGAPQRGAEARDGRTLSLRGVLIDRTEGTGVFASGIGTEVRLLDVVVRNTEASPSGSTGAGVGIQVQLGAYLDGTRILVSANRIAGIGVVSEGSTVALSDFVVQDTRPRAADGVGGMGIDVSRGAHLDATRALVSGNRVGGVVITEVGAQVTMTDAIVRDTKSGASDGRNGRGISASSGASFTATRMVLAHNQEVGLFVHGEADVALSDVVIRDTTPQVAGAMSGMGVSVQLGGRLEATGVVLSGNTEAGIFIASPGSVASVTDAVVQQTVPNPTSGLLGRGVSVQFGGRFEASRLLITDNREVGFLASNEDTVVALSDSIIRDTTSHASGDFGRGLQGQYGAHVEATRLEIERSVEVGALAIGGAAMVLVDTSVRSVQIAPCATTTCVADPYGYGAGAYGGTLSLTRFQVRDSDVCGVMVAPLFGGTDASSLDLASGVIAESGIGACVQIAGYDFGRLTAAVQYIDNVTNLDSTSLPVPQAVGVVPP